MSTRTIAYAAAYNLIWPPSDESEHSERWWILRKAPLLASQRNCGQSTHGSDFNLEEVLAGAEEDWAKDAVL